jgi:hypothetical protein
MLKTSLVFWNKFLRKKKCPLSRTILLLQNFFDDVDFVFGFFDVSKCCCPPLPDVQAVLHECCVISAGRKQPLVIRQELHSSRVGGERLHLPVVRLHTSQSQVKVKSS